MNMHVLYKLAEIKKLDHTVHAVASEPLCSMQTDTELMTNVRVFY